MGKIKKNKALESQLVTSEFTSFFPRKRRSKALVMLGLGFSLLYGSAAFATPSESSLYIPSRRISTRDIVDDRVTGSEAFSNPQVASLKEENLRLSQEVRLLKQDLLNTTRQLHDVKSNLFASTNPEDRAQISELRLELANKEELNQQLIDIAKDLEQSLDLRELQISNLEQELQEQTEILSSQGKFLNNSSQEFASTQNSIAAELEELTQALQTEKAYTQKLEESLMVLKHHIDSGSPSSKNLERDIEKLQSQVATLETERSYHSDLYRLTTEQHLAELKKVNQEKENLTSQLVAAKEKLDNAKFQVAELGELYRTSLDQERLEAEQLARDKKDLVSSQASQKQQFEALSQELAFQRSQAEDSAQLEALLSKTITVCEAKQAEVDQLERGLTALSTKSELLEKELGNKNSTIASLRNEYANLLNQIDVLSSSLEETEAQNNEMSKLIASLQGKTDLTEDQVVSIEKELQLAVTARDMTSSDLTNTLHQLKDALDSKNTLETQVAELSTLLKAEEQRADVLELELQDALVSLNQQLEESNTLSIEMKLNQEQIAKLVTRGNELEEELQQSLEAHNHESDASDSLSQKLQSKQAGIARLETENNALKAGLNTTREEREALARSSTEYQTEISRLTQALENKNSLANDLELLNQELQEAHALQIVKIDTLEKALSSSQTRINELAATIENSVEQTDTQSERALSLSQQIAAANDRVKVLENELLYQLSEYNLQQNDCEALAAAAESLLEDLEMEKTKRIELEANLHQLGNIQEHYADLQKQLLEITGKANSMSSLLEAERERTYVQGEQISELKSLTSAQRTDLSAVVHDLQSTLHDEQQKSQLLLKERDELYVRWKDDNETLNALAARLEDATSKATLYESQLITGQESLSSKIDEVDNLKSAVFTLTNDLQQEKQHTEALVAKHDGHYQALQKEIDALTMSIDKEKQQSDNLKDFFKTKQEEFAQKHKQTTEERDQLHAQLLQLEDQLAMNLNHVAALEKELSVYSQHSNLEKETFATLQKQLEAKQNSITDLHTKLEWNERALAEKEREFEALAQEHFHSSDSLTQDIDSLTLALLEERKEANSLKQELAQAKTTLTAQQELLAQLDGDLSLTASEKSDMSDLISTKENRLATLERQMEGSEQRIADLQQELEAHKNLLANKNIELHDLQKTHSTDVEGLNSRLAVLIHRLEEEKLTSNRLKGELDDTTAKYHAHMQQSSELEEALHEAQGNAQELEEKLAKQQADLNVQQKQLSTLNSAFSSNQYELANNLAHLESKLAEKEQQLLSLQSQLSLSLTESRSKEENVSKLRDQLQNFEGKTQELSRELNEHRRMLDLKNQEAENLHSTVERSERELCNHVLELETRLEDEVKTSEQNSQHLSDALELLEKEKEQHAAARQEAQHLAKELNLIAAHLAEGEALKVSLYDELNLALSNLSSEAQELLEAKEMELQKLTEASQATTLEFNEELRELISLVESEQLRNEQLQNQVKQTLAEATTQAELRLEIERKLAGSESRLAVLEQDFEEKESYWFALQGQVDLLAKANDEALSALVQEQNRAEELSHALANTQDSLTQKVAPEAIAQLANELEAALALASERERALFMAEEMTTAALSNYRDAVENQRLLEWEKEELERSFQRELAKANRQNEKILSDFARQEQMGRVIAPEKDQIVMAKAPMAPRKGSHIVSKGETLRSIAEQHFGTANRWTDIYEANSSIISNKDNIVVGMNLSIPE